MRAFLTPEPLRAVLSFFATVAFFTKNFMLFGRHGRATVYAGSKRYLLSPGDLVIIHSHDPHDVVGADAGCYYTVIKFLPEILLSGAQTYSEYIYALLLMESMENKQIFFPAA